MAQVLDVAEVERMIASRVNVDSSGYELYSIPCVKKRRGKMVRVAKRLYHLVLVHFYHPRYDYAVCAYPKVYPKSLSLSREVYPVFVRFSFVQKYQHDNEAVSCHTICGKFPHGEKDRKVGYTFLDKLRRSVYSRARRNNMPDHSTAQEMPAFSPEQHMMYENTISGRDSTEVAYLQLRRAIVRCEIPSGVQLSQRELSQLTGVGRTPLREALRMLQREGLVEAEPNHRVRVADFSISDLEQLYAMRISLEALAIRLTVPLLQADELRRLEGFLTQMAGLPTPEEYERL